MYSAVYYFYITKTFGTRRSGIKALDKMFRKFNFQLAYYQKDEYGRGHWYNLFSRRNGNKAKYPLCVWFNGDTMVARFDALPDGHHTDTDEGLNALAQAFKRDGWEFSQVMD